MDILVAIVIGGVVGWLAGFVMKTGGQMGLLANVVVGIVGSALGHWLAPSLGIRTVDSLGRFLVGLGGAVLLIALLKLLKVFK